MPTCWGASAGQEPDDQRASHRSPPNLLPRGQGAAAAPLESHPGTPQLGPVSHAPSDKLIYKPAGPWELGPGAGSKAPYQMQAMAPYWSPASKGTRAPPAAPPGLHRGLARALRRPVACGSACEALGRSLPRAAVWGRSKNCLAARWPCPAPACQNTPVRSGTPQHPADQLRPSSWCFCSSFRNPEQPELDTICQDLPGLIFTWFSLERGCPGSLWGNRSVVTGRRAEPRRGPPTTGPEHTFYGLWAPKSGHQGSGAGRGLPGVFASPISRAFGLRWAWSPR